MDGNSQDEKILREFHAAEKENRRLVLESVRFYLYMPTPAAALSAVLAITEKNGTFDAAGRQDLQFYLVEQAWEAIDDRWAIRVLKQSYNAIVDGDVRNGRTFFEAIATRFGGSYEGASPCYSEIQGLALAAPDNPRSVN